MESVGREEGSSRVIERPAAAVAAAAIAAAVAAAVTVASARRDGRFRKYRCDYRPTSDEADVKGCRDIARTTGGLNYRPVGTMHLLQTYVSFPPINHHHHTQTHTSAERQPADCHCQ